MHENEISAIIIDCCIRIHKTLGPGLLECVYEEALCYELSKRAIKFERQKPFAVNYEKIKFDVGFRADVIVEEKVIVEIKSVEQIIPVFKKKLYTYLNLTNVKLGLLINFNVSLLKDGIVRIVNKLEEPIKYSSAPSASLREIEGKI